MECIDPVSGKPLRVVHGFAEEEKHGFPADGSAEEMPDLSAHSNLVAEVLKKAPELYERLKGRQTKLGTKLARCIKAGVDSPACQEVDGDMSLFAGDEECFDTFSELFDVVIARRLGQLPEGEVVLKQQPCREKSLSQVSARGPTSKRLDPSDTVVRTVKVIGVRNLKGSRFLPAMDKAERAEVEGLLAKAVLKMAPEVRGVYFPLRFSKSYAPRAGGMDHFEELRLKDAGVHFGAPDSKTAAVASGSCRDWPHGRGVFTTADRNLAIWVNHQEHVTLVSVRPGDDLQTAYRDFQRTLDRFGEVIRRSRPGSEHQVFAKSDRLGVLTSCLSSLGAAMKAYVTLKVPKLVDLEVSDPESAAGQWRSWLLSHGMQVEPARDSEGKIVEQCFEISNREQFDISEVEIVDRVLEVASCVVAAELALPNLSAAEQHFPFSHAEADGRASRLSMPSCVSVMSGPASTVDDAVAKDLVNYVCTKETLKKAEQATEGDEEDLENMRNRLKNSLFSKLEDGSLDKALEDAADDAGAMQFAALPPPPLPPPTDEESTHDPDFEIDAIGAPAKPRLSLKKSPEPELPAVVPESKKSEMASVRQKAAGLLFEAASNGELENALREVKSKKAAQSSVRAQVAGILQQAARQGDLASLLKEVEDSNLLRERVSKQLIQASVDGSLNAAMQEVKHSATREASLEELRRRAGDLLTQASLNGELERALEEVQSQKSKELSLDQVRLKTADLLAEAAASGSLEKILQDVKKGGPAPQAKAPDDIRAKAAVLLTQAADSGDLERILLKVKEDTQARREVKKAVRLADLPAEARDYLIQAAMTGDLQQLVKDVELQKAALENVRQRAAHLLAEAADSGLLEKTLQDVKASKSQESADAMRQRAAAVLSQAAVNGDLEKALSEVKSAAKKESVETVRQKAAAVLAEASINGELEKALSDVKLAKKQDSVESVRQKAAALLSEASTNGDLEKALAEVKASKASKASALSSQEYAALKMTVRDALARGAEDGSLERSLMQVKAESTNEDGIASIRLKAASLLSEAATNGTLEKALAEVKTQMSSAEIVRQKAAALLCEAAENGNLEKVLEEIQDGTRIEVLRGKAAGLLSEAAASGNLEKVLLEVKSQRKDGLEDVRQKAAHLLSEASANGELERALAEVKSQSNKVGVEAVKQKAANLLSEACTNGELEKALAEVKSQSKKAQIDSVRQRAADLLSEACTSGDLEKALAEVKSQKKAQVQAEVGAVLESALESGALEKALAEVFLPGEATRGRIEQRLVASLDSGELEKALSSVMGEPAKPSAAPVPPASAKPEGSPKRPGRNFTRNDEAEARKEAAQAAAEATAWCKMVEPNHLSIEQFSAKMFLEAFSEKGKRLDELSKLVKEAETKIALRSEQSQQLQAEVSQNRLELAHLDLDLDWHRTALTNAEQRRVELQDVRRKLLGALHGKMYELTDVSGSLTPRAMAALTNSQMNTTAPAGTLSLAGFASLGSTMDSQVSAVTVPTPRRLAPM